MKLSWSSIHTALVIGGTVLGLAFGAGAQVALSKSKIEVHEMRLDKIDATLGQQVLDNARNIQRLDDISETLHRIERHLEK